MAFVKESKKCFYELLGHLLVQFASILVVLLSTEVINTPIPTDLSHRALVL
ncbi:hypothetical protein NC652_023177 [Populus alba x Populus x berolinensis]|uniref:Uncharacterized protein n=1 Tax=Populus alba x Populus x berolinensis TaxID=444605 RepID=A0AAD6MFZ2_9ROSI|nr:hypothetical protein NC652_023177 [Populus alba x Populus x berolinensis]KAJ6984836.1 hypothetical protein NC653_022971 [Populus alba x Populus x berolinensis]